MASSVLLFEIGAIGGPFDLSVLPRSKPLRPLASPLRSGATSRSPSARPRTVIPRATSTAKFSSRARKRQAAPGSGSRLSRPSSGHGSALWA